MTTVESLYQSKRFKGQSSSANTLPTTLFSTPTGTANLSVTILSQAF